MTPQEYREEATRLLAEAQTYGVGHPLRADALAQAQINATLALGNDQPEWRHEIRVQADLTDALRTVPIPPPAPPTPPTPAAKKTTAPRKRTTTKPTTSKGNTK
ncbi:hypothetical protein [Kribbella sp. CA-293567]|uniref:hypothetical protein n=1 Tax=Kribbella sp. CA-293567 TaxID=3002436 RepID=UPI0022DCF5A7|nr:hypothetical protein [Kribbella sp. CA-293567]WBQ03822.1 hypothetical protein OX958_28110 [Kribbella sp. CA-293567]